METLLKTITILLIMALSVAVAEESLVEAERFHIEKNTAKISKVIIENNHGDIRLRQTTEKNLVFHAVSQYSKTHRASIDEELKDGVLSLKVSYKNLPTEKSLERVDVAIVVPKGVELDIKIEKGNLSSKKLENQLKVVSESSDIELKSTGFADLFTKHGNISYTLLSNESSDEVNLKTFNGSVSLYFHEDNRPFVQTITGSVVTSNSLNVLKNKKIENRVASYNQDKFFDTAKIQTDTGLIQLVEIEQIYK